MRLLLVPFRTLATLLSGFLATLVFAPLAIVVGRARRDSPWIDRFARSWSRAWLAPAGCRLEVSGRENVDTTKSYWITGAPRVMKGKVLIGNGVTEMGPIRGYVTAYDAETGKQAWRFYTVPGNPAEGFENQAMAMAAKTWTGEWWRFGGGGTVWNSITYDPEFGAVYIGTGNGAPWNRKIRSPPERPRSGHLRQGARVGRTGATRYAGDRTERWVLAPQGNLRRRSRAARCRSCAGR